MDAHHQMLITEHCSCMFKISGEMTNTATMMKLILN